MEDEAKARERAEGYAMSRLRYVHPRIIISGLPKINRSTWDVGRMNDKLHLFYSAELFDLGLAHNWRILSGS